MTEPSPAEDEPWDGPLVPPALMDAVRQSEAEASVSRVINLYEQWVKAGPPPLGTSMSRWWDRRLVELRAAILNPDREQRGRPTHPDGTPYRYHEIQAEGWGYCDGCRMWSTATPESPHQCAPEATSPDLDGITDALAGLAKHVKRATDSRQSDFALSDNVPAGPPCIPDHSVPVPCPGCTHDERLFSPAATDPPIVGTARIALAVSPELADGIPAESDAKAALARVRAALDEESYGGPEREDVITAIRAALDQPKGQ